MPFQPYVSIDLETTGLDPQACQILEFGAVIDIDGETSIDDLPYFRRVLRHKEIHGEPFAIQMNAKIIHQIATGKLPATEQLSASDMIDRLCPPADVVNEFMGFLIQNGIDPSKGFQPAGKNFASFDKPFLEFQMPGWKDKIRMKHRTVDPGNLYWNIGQEIIPDTKTCYERAMLDPTVAHTAVEDAKGVVLLVRAKLKDEQRKARLIESGGKFTEAFGMLQASLHPSLLVNADDPMGMARDIIAYLKEGRPGDN